MLLKKAMSLAVPAMVATAAFLHAHAIGTLVDATAMPKSIAPFAEARAATSSAAAPRSAAPILKRNAFDHLTRLEAEPPAVSDDDVTPSKVPPCDGVRTLIAVGAGSPDESFAALDVAGKRRLGRRGRAVDGLEIVFVGADRVWLRRGGALCQAPLFASREPAPARLDARGEAMP